MGHRGARRTTTTCSSPDGSWSTPRTPASTRSSTCSTVARRLPDRVGTGARRCADPEDRRPRLLRFLPVNGGQTRATPPTNVLDVATSSTPCASTMTSSAPGSSPPSTTSTSPAPATGVPARRPNPPRPDSAQAWPPSRTRQDGAGNGVQRRRRRHRRSPAGPDRTPAAALAAYDGRLRAPSGHSCRTRAMAVRSRRCAIAERRGRTSRTGVPHRSGGAINEVDLAHLLGQALAMRPQVINLSAGCHTRQRPAPQGLRATCGATNPQTRRTGRWSSPPRATTPRHRPSTRRRPPGRSGVGSLDQDNEVSSFSNYRQSADVFVLGRNHVNQFPIGTLHLPRGARTWATTGCSRRAREVERNVLRRPLLAGLSRPTLPPTPGTRPRGGHGT